MQRAGAELKRAIAAISKVQPESEQSRALEARLLTQLMLCANGYGFGTPELTQAQERMAMLGKQAQSNETASEDAASHVPDAAKYEALRNTGVAQWMETAQGHGVLSYIPVKLEALSQTYADFVETGSVFEQAALVAPDIARLSYANNIAIASLIIYARLHVCPEFDKDVFGKGCSKLRNNIKTYDFESVHAECKSMGVTIDLFLYGLNEAGLLLWCGDVEAAKAGWRIQIESRRKMEALVQKGERTWAEYMFEELMFLPVLVAGMLAAGEMEMVRELIPHTFAGIALRDPLVASEMEKTIVESPFNWQGPDAYCNWRAETKTLQTRALAAVADDGEVDVETLREWLPRPDELIYIAEHEWVTCGILTGAAHPAILCATLYGTRLDAWDDVEAIVNGVLAIPSLGDGKGFGMQPLVRIEAWRLLARCRGACGKAAEACEALERAVGESRAAGYVWMESVSLGDMVEWVEGDVEKASVEMRLNEVTSYFKRDP